MASTYSRVGSWNIESLLRTAWHEPDALPPPPALRVDRVLVNRRAQAFRRSTFCRRAGGLLPARRAVPHPVRSCVLRPRVLGRGSQRSRYRSRAPLERPVALVQRRVARLLRTADRGAEAGARRRGAGL